MENVMVLSRGGYLVDTPDGYIQFGSPPETIKETMLMPKNVPEIFVLTSELFNWDKGISTAEIEFPIYYNFFIRSKKTTIICTDIQFESIKDVLQESLFGPREIDLASDFERQNENIPAIQNEMNYFRRGLKLSDLISIGIFKNNRFTIKGSTIVIQNDGTFGVFRGDERIATVPPKVEYTAQYKIGERLAEPYRPPLFGVTCLGPSHGFDPYQNTSGFIIWLNHSGIMVDPPVNSTEWLNDSNVNPKLIDSIILTHCHADHDAGTFQKILEEHKVTIYTTETVMMSFLRKYSALSNMPANSLLKLFSFHPVKIGKPVFIHDGQFDFFYTLHSIPTTGFKMAFQDQTFVYSSDHNNDPELHKKLLESGVISKTRFEELKNFPWNSKVIYHESGVPPLHTPIMFLDSLPEKIKKRTVIYHIAEKDFPPKTSLTMAKFGMENTIYFNTKPPRFETAYQILGILKNLDFCEDLPIHKAREFISIVEEEKHKKDDIIIKKGAPGDKFYIILSGNIIVDSGGLEEKKIYGSYDYFGEVALIKGEPRAADVVAATDIVAYTIQRDKFLNFIVGTEFEKTLKRLANIRNSETWNLLSSSPFFGKCTSSQKTWLESIFILKDFEKPGILIHENRPIDYIYIIRSGEISVSIDGRISTNLVRGDYAGSIQDIQKNEQSRFTFSHVGPVSLYAMEAENLGVFLTLIQGCL
jgi:CRP-like cAMP-binding protein